MGKITTVHVSPSNNIGEANPEDAPKAPWAHTVKAGAVSSYSTTSGENSPVFADGGNGRYEVNYRFEAPTPSWEDRLNAPDMKPFSTPQEMAEAMQALDEYGRRRYTNDEVYRMYVETRVALTDFDPSLGYNPRPEPIIDFGPNGPPPELGGDNLLAMQKAWHKTRGW